MFALLVNKRERVGRAAKITRFRVGGLKQGIATQF